MSAPAGTLVRINKPTIIDGAWRDVPTIVRMDKGRIVEERLPLRTQLTQAAQMLAVMVLAFPPIFMAADWLRYS